MLRCNDDQFERDFDSFPKFHGTTNINQCRIHHLSLQLPSSLDLTILHRDSNFLLNVARHESFRKHRNQTIILFRSQCLLMSVPAHHKKDDDDNDHRGGNRFVLRRRQRLLGWPPFIPHTLFFSSTLPPVSD